jgi:hypothetical protein
MIQKFSVFSLRDCLLDSRNKAHIRYSIESRDMEGSETTEAGCMPEMILKLSLPGSASHILHTTDMLYS